MIRFKNAQHSLPAAAWIRAAYTPYLCELTHYEPTLYALDAWGNYHPDLLSWWLDYGTGLPLLIEWQGQAVGFVFLNLSPHFRDLRADLKIAEFFIAPPFRRQKIGAATAARLAEIYGGVWEVEAIRANLPAVQFWQGFIEKRGAVLDETRSEAHLNWLFQLRSGFEV